MTGQAWECPHCKVRSAFVPCEEQASRAFKKINYYEYGPEIGDSLEIFGEIQVRECQNEDCQKISVYAKAYESCLMPMLDGLGAENHDLTDWIQICPKPMPDSVDLPDYVPDKVRDDFREAYLIKDISPKASVALCRYCIQYMIRDFWGISKSRLVDEIADLEKSGKSPTSIKMLDAIRDMGNFGAHPEKDTSTIIEVDPEDADLAVQIVQTIIKDWYIDKHEREARISAIDARIAAKKKLREAASSTVVSSSSE
ncbi:DUF4145 domain-containing protein [Eggerthella sinensis]|uniref:DUF4145 domain-containing protein n=1 Tax=Eggerthella sinensis TaxID=242230 RepID=UPI001D066A58|nr:DUF4145 domain-containing protein [Eggerthella sinensis]MCB7038998.1 DUF4145 domain-containing protein [Eggerthella sinensis]